MAADESIQKIKVLPPELIKSVENFVDMLGMEQEALIQPEKKQRTSGQLKGKVQMSPDFDEPLEDLKDYM